MRLLRYAVTFAFRRFTLPSGPEETKRLPFAFG